LHAAWPRDCALCFIEPHVNARSAQTLGVSGYHALGVRLRDRRRIRIHRVQDELYVRLTALPESTAELRRNDEAGLHAAVRHGVTQLARRQKPTCESETPAHAQVG